MSTRALIFSLLGLAVFFGGLHFMIVRPDPRTAQDVAAHPNDQDREPASLPNKAFASEVESIIRSHPRLIEKKSDVQVKGTGVLGIRLDDPNEIAFLKTDEGRARFFSQFQGAQNFDAAVQDLGQAWAQTPEDDLVKREALLEMTSGLMNFTESDRLKKQVLDEYDRFSKEEQPESRDYASRALQDYLQHETDLVRRNKELERRNIPILNLEPSKTNN